MDRKTGLTVGVWLLAVLCASVWAELDSKLDQQWEQWKTTHEKKYNNEVEELGRRALWEKKLNQINHHNLEASLGLHTYTLAVNHLSDLTEDEKFKRSAPMKIPEDMTPTLLNVTDEDVPDSKDWTKFGYVTSVKDQKNCQSCWAFSAAGALEGLLAKTTGRLVDLSPQNLMDCSRPYGDGCKPGFIHVAFQYVIQNGIASDASYPYEAQDGRCRYDPKYRAATCSSYHFVEQNELALQQAVATIGPISVVVDEKDISNYHGGVFNNPSCRKQINHAMLLVGYGTDRATGLDYWLIKNSWGPGWGENGYMRLARNKNQMCGISMYAYYPL
uniref:Cathepsin S n=1 Tax=Neogobius melanostomus TaxID=47308 RepID=A0A8C6SUG4_9GOBI